jgi:hypothetical protein
MKEIMMKKQLEKIKDKRKEIIERTISRFSDGKKNKIIKERLTNLLKDTIKYGESNK